MGVKRTGQISILDHVSCLSDVEEVRNTTRMGITARLQREIAIVMKRQPVAVHFE